MPDLNRTQFHDVDPHQQALPGMEHLAHPWAGPLSHGYMLHSSREENSTILDAVKSGEKKPSAYLQWAGKAGQKKSGYEPGEVTYVSNRAGGQGKRGAKGLAGALFHSAHYFNVGQSTVPIHSSVRTDKGEHFASKVRPELRPDIRWDEHARDARGDRGAMRTLAGEPTRKTKPEWSLPEGFHPYQQHEIARDQSTAASMRRPKTPKGQGKLF